MTPGMSWRARSGAAPLSVLDVYQVLVERISSSAFAVGSRLPSCRALAAELGSNPSTVDRAIQRLAADGLVRTIPRRGTFVSATEAPHRDDLDALSTELDRLVARALAAGLSVDAVREMLDDALVRVRRQPRVAFVECNQTDLDQMAALVENATGVELARVLLEGSADHLDDEFDVVVTPLFHLADLAHRVRGLDTVIEMNFNPSSKALRRLAMIDRTARVTVAAPTTRGLERLSSLAEQYYRGALTRFNSTVDPPDALADTEILIRTHASERPATPLPRLREEILVDWDLDPASATTFRSRVDAAVGRRRV
jgi:DNA-binding transcriptional regulator YhcF (GntR family)